jgi:hypothetical protein
VKYFYLIYCSVPTKKLKDEEVEELLLVARQANHIRNITGMLLCLQDMYVQLIEGDEADTRQLYINLTNDPRHRNITILKEGYIENRFFPEWSMGYDKNDITLKDSEGSFNISEQQVFKLFKIIDEGFG